MDRSSGLGIRDSAPRISRTRHSYPDAPACRCRRSWSRRILLIPRRTHGGGGEMITGGGKWVEILAHVRKASDEFTVPLCRTHHCEVHRCGEEGSWWQKTAIDPLAAERTLWLETHPLPKAEATPNDVPVVTAE